MAIGSGLVFASFSHSVALGTLLSKNSLAFLNTILFFFLIRSGHSAPARSALGSWISCSLQGMSSFFIFPKIYLSIYWKVRYTEMRRDTEEDLPSNDSLPK